MYFDLFGHEVLTASQSRRIMAASDDAWVQGWAIARYLHQEGFHPLEAKNHLQSEFNLSSEEDISLIATYLHMELLREQVGALSAQENAH